MIKKIKSKINQAIRDFNMFTRKDRIAVAISGGKDSVLLAYILKNMGYNITPVFIDLGIRNSEESKERIKELSDSLNINLQVIDIKKELGFTIEKVYKHFNKYTCRQCGAIKRYLLNLFCIDKNFDVIATGHNMDDEIENLLSNNLRWDLNKLNKTFPVLEKKDAFIKRVKPMCYIRKREIEKVVEILGLKYCQTDCEYSKLGSRIRYRDVIRLIDSINLKTMEEYYKNFLKKREKIKIITEEKDIKKCSCGNITSTYKCSLCRIKEEIKTD